MSTPLSAECGCFFTQLGGRVNVALCRNHSERVADTFDREEPDPIGALWAALDEAH